MKVQSRWGIKVMRWIRRTKSVVGAGFLVGVLAACTNANAPLEPKVRYRIDSIATVQMQRAQAEIDSLCALEHLRRLPVLTDSIRRQRLREIERQLQTLTPQ